VPPDFRQPAQRPKENAPTRPTVVALRQGDQ